MLHFQRHTRTYFVIISFVLLFLSFNYNLFHAVNPKKFYDFQSDSEALVIGRMVKSREDGIFSSQARMGRYYELPGDMNRNQERLYFTNTVEGKYGEYDSQLGLQGIIYSYLDSVLASTGLEPRSRYEIYHTVNSLIFCTVLLIIIMILYKDIGIKACAFIVFTILLSRWQVYFAKNFYWVIYMAFLPMLAVLVAYKLEENGRRISTWLVALLVCLLVFLKSLMGYEYISTILIATVTPLVYFAVKNHWHRKVFLTRFISIGSLGLLGFFLAILLHMYQLSLAYGGYNEAYEIVKERVLARTQADPEMFRGTPYYGSQIASYWEVLYIYLVKGGSFRMKIPFLFWILMFTGVSYNFWRRAGRFQHGIADQRIYKALIVTTWFSLLAALSWIILAKSHSEIHTQINYIVWHLPFMLFGCALLGKYWKPDHAIPQASSA